MSLRVFAVSQFQSPTWEPESSYASLYFITLGMTTIQGLMQMETERQIQALPNRAPGQTPSEKHHSKHCHQVLT